MIKSIITYMGLILLILILNLGLYGFAILRSSAVGVANTPRDSHGQVIEMASGFALNLKDGDLTAKRIVSTGTGEEIAGATAGYGLSIIVFPGKISSLAGVGFSQTSVLGPLSFSELKNIKGKFIGYSFGIPLGKGFGIASFSTTTQTQIKDIFTIDSNKNQCPTINTRFVYNKIIKQ